MGDNYEGFRVVGTNNTDYLQLYASELGLGTAFVKPMDAVIGATVADKTGLKTGDTFSGVHGFMSEGHSHDDFHHTVTGILKMSGNVIDNLILTPIESVWMAHSDRHGHVEHERERDDNCEHHHHEEDDEHDHESPNNESPDMSDLADQTWEQLQHKLSDGIELTEEEAPLYNERKGELVVKKADSSQSITAFLVFCKKNRRL